MPASDRATARSTRHLYQHVNGSCTVAYLCKMAPMAKFKCAPSL